MKKCLPFKSLYEIISRRKCFHTPSEKSLILQFTLNAIHNHKITCFWIKNIFNMIPVRLYISNCYDHHKY